MNLPTIKQRPLTTILALFVTLVVLIHRPLFFGMALLERDMLRWTIPARAVLRAAMVHGEIPVWNPYEGIGFPVFSDPLYGPFYPPTLLTLLGPLVGATMLFMLAHTLLGGVGAILLVRRLGVGFLAALMSGLAWSLSGYVTSEWNTGSRLVSTAWLPWSALAWLYLARKCEENRPRWWCAMGVAAFPAAMTFLSGEVFLGTISTAFGFLVGLSELDWRDRPSLLRHAGAFVSTGILAAAAGAVSILPAALLASTTDRAAPLLPEIANGYSVRWGRIIELVAPGTIGHAWADYPAEASAYTHGPLLNLSIYLGASTVALALCASYRTHLPRVFLGLAAFFLVLSLGNATPLFAVVRWVFRPLAYMRSTEKYLACLLPLVTSLAALGFHRIAEERVIPWRRLGVFAALLALYAALSSTLYSPIIARYVRHGCLRSLAVVLVLLGLLRALRTRPAALAVALVALVFLDCADNVRREQHYYPSEVVYRPPAGLADVPRPPNTQAVGPVRVFRAPSVNSTYQSAIAFPGRLLTIDTLHENTSNLFGVATLPGYDPALPRALTRVLASRRVAALRLLSVDYTLAATPSLNPDAPRPGLEVVNGVIPGTRLYRVLDTLPRAFVPGSVTRMPTVELERSILLPDVVSGRTALIDSPLSFAPTAPEAAVPCEGEFYHQGRITVRCTTAHPTLAVLVEQYTRGWTATVDEHPAPVIQVNQLHIGVPIPSGTHRIRLRYRPPGLAVGAVLSIASFVAMALCAIAIIRVRLRGRSISINLV